jgi:cell division protein FtsB
MMPKINTTDLQKKIKQFSDIRVIGLVAFGVVVLLVYWSILNVLQLNYGLEKQKAALEQKNRLAKLENENLNLKNVYLQSDEYLEISARNQLNKAAPGEKLYLIPNSVAMSHTVTLPKTVRQLQEEKDQNKSKFRKNLEAWRNFFFHNIGG